MQKASLWLLCCQKSSPFAEGKNVTLLSEAMQGVTVVRPNPILTPNQLSRNY
jgi:hypothetical protein